MKFKESPLVKNHKILTGTKRDMRKKVVKSTTPTSDLKKPTTLKRQHGGNIFTTYNSIAPYEGPTFEQPLATVEIKELPVNRLEANRRQVMAKAEEPKQEPVEEPVNTEPLPTSKEEKVVKETPKAAPTQIKTKDEFVKTMTPAFENALKAKGLDTKYAKYLVAQSALESNWGKSQSGKFNFGGIKGKGTTRRTREVVNGQNVYINDSFRDFKDIDDYANYHVSLLNNKRYNAFTGDFIDRVVKGGYATDPKYRQALSNVYNQIAKAQVGMKIPKLKGAGELRARILRRFKQEKLDAHNEELIGFDWSRYKSYKPKPEARTPVTPQSEQLENGGVIKAQDGLIAKAISKVKKILPNEEPKEPVDVVDIIKEYAPSAATSFLSGSINPFINKLLGKRVPPVGKVRPLDYETTFQYIKRLENPHDKGIDYKSGIAKNYDSRTGGWGTDFVSGPHRHLKHKIKSGKWTVREAKDVAVKDMRTHDKVIMDNMKNYTERPDTISEGPRLLMAQARYHYGNIQKSFPEWAKAVVEGDADKQKELALKLANGYDARHNSIQNINIYKKDSGK